MCDWDDFRTERDYNYPEKCFTQEPMEKTLKNAARPMFYVMTNIKTKKTTVSCLLAKKLSY